MSDSPTVASPATSLSRPGPVVARALPFGAYIAFMIAEAQATTFIDPTLYYGLQITVTVLLLAWGWKSYIELHRPAWRLDKLFCAAAVGAAVYVAWINLDASWMRMGDGREITATLSGTGATWPSLLLRAIGAVMVVPIMEELFWRSFLLRWIDESNFLRLPPAAISWRAVIICSALFGAEHDLWLAGIIAGFAFALLYRYSGSLWAVIAAHALTNALLENWWGRGSWPFI